MFNLEQAITDWRQQMLAAGIQTPEPLDELESHLREDVEQNLRTGLDGQSAFEAAVQRIGRAGGLTTEFAKIGGVEKSDKWERRLAISISFGVVIPLSLYGLLKNDLSLAWRLLGFADVAVIVLAIFGCRRVNRAFPVIPDKRIRMAIGLAFGLLSMAGMAVFMNFILPNFELTEGQLLVVVLWALTLMAALGAVWAGLDEAARRPAAAPD